MKKIIRSLSSLTFVFVLYLSFVSPYFALAQENETKTPKDFETNVTATGPTTLTNPLALKGINTPQALVGNIIESTFGIVGSLALVMFIYGGFLWMTSAGSSEQVKKGKDIFIWAVVGLVVIFSAYSIVRFVLEGIGA